MPDEIIREFKSRISAARFFNSLGRPLEERRIGKFSVEQEPGWPPNVEEDIRASEAWSNFRLERSNDWSMAVADLDEDLFERFWNPVTVALKTALRPTIDAAIKAIPKGVALPEKFSDRCHWDVLAAGQEHFFSQRLPSLAPGFYLALLDVYEAGWVPTGWLGGYPDGSLLVL